MQRISVRTLTLLLELLTVVVTYQWIGWIHIARPDAVWLANDRAVVQPCSNPEPNCILDS